jgi:transposase-like protein
MGKMKTYDAAYKTEVCKRVEEGGESAASVSRETGVNEHTLHTWLKRYRQNSETPFPGSGHIKPEDVKLKRLLRENRERRERIAKLVEREFLENHRILGSKKITEKLRKNGERGRRGLVAKIMREKGLTSKVVKKYKATTNSNHNLPVAENLLNREFYAFRLNRPLA